MHIAERGRAMSRDVDADFFHDGDGERIGVARAHACQLYINAPAREMAQDGRGHRRAHSVAAAGEEDRARQVGISHRQGIIPSSGARR